MLSTAVRFVAGFVLFLTIVVVGTMDAGAAPGASCQVVTRWDAASQTWVSAVVCPEQPGASTSPAPSAASSSCLNGFQKPIPCSLNGATWTPAWGCYAGPSGQVPDAAHQGMTAYQCKYNEAGAAIPSGIVPIYWLAGGPAAVDPAALASQAVASMRLRAIRIGMVPEDVPGSMGIVGVPDVGLLACGTWRANAASADVRLFFGGGMSSCSRASQASRAASKRSKQWESLQ